VHGIRVERGLTWSLALSGAVHAAILAAVVTVWLRLDGEPAAPIVVDLAENGPAPVDVHASRPGPSPSPSRPAAPPPRAVREMAPPLAPPATVTEPAPSPPAGRDAPAAAVAPPPDVPAIASEPPRPPPSSGAAGRSATGAEVVPPQPTERATPRYPEPARLAGVQGTVVLRARVTVEGAVAEVVIDRSAGHTDLDTAAVEALRRWRFEPARRAGRPVEVWIVIPVHFSLG